EKWRKEAEQKNAAHLLLTRDYLMRHAAEDITEAQFPDSLPAGEFDVPLKYRFDPGHALDGITATVPLALLNTLDAAAFDWLVPGMVLDKVAFAFKALPNSWRRHLTPPSEHVTRFLQSEGKSQGGAQGPLGDAVARYASRA